MHLYIKPPFRPFTRFGPISIEMVDGPGLIRKAIDDHVADLTAIGVLLQPGVLRSPDGVAEWATRKVLSDDEVAAIDALVPAGCSEFVFRWTDNPAYPCDVILRRGTGEILMKHAYADEIGGIVETARDLVVRTNCPPIGRNNRVSFAFSGRMVGGSRDRTYTFNVTSGTDLCAMVHERGKFLFGVMLDGVVRMYS